ncbi:MAG: hypothetical protein IJG81_08815 [Muribaculaceae bacterium]|nr:hypothetical protein [Muribaculaceae bacterium]
MEFFAQVYIRGGDSIAIEQTVKCDGVPLNTVAKIIQLLKNGNSCGDFFTAINDNFVFGWPLGLGRKGQLARFFWTYEHKN